MLYMSVGTLAMHSSLNTPFFGGAIAYVALAHKLFFGDGAVSPGPLLLRRDSPSHVLQLFGVHCSSSAVHQR